MINSVMSEMFMHNPRYSEGMLANGEYVLYFDY